MSEPMGVLCGCGGQFWRKDAYPAEIICVRCGADIKDRFRQSRSTSYRRIITCDPEAAMCAASGDCGEPDPRRGPGGRTGFFCYECGASWPTVRGAPQNGARGAS